MISRKLIVCLSFLIPVSAFAQVIDYNKQFFNGKQLFREGKYNLAMETLKPLIPYASNNQFSEYASFYYALAAHNQGYMAVSKDMFNQLKSLHPAWDKIDEVNFWLGKIYLDSKDYFQGLKMLSSIKDKKMEKDIDALKAKALVNVTDIETLKMMREEYPKDEVVGKALVAALAKDMANVESRTLLESLISQYGLKKTDYFPETPKSTMKDSYSVGVMFPFLVNTLDPTPGRKRNQIVLDFYEGMQLAVDTLAQQNVKISLRAYDTDRNVEKIKSLLNTDELKSIDLLVGPFFPEENKPIQDFSLANKINVFNPFSNNSDVIGNNPYAFLYQPSIETLGKKSGEFMASTVRKKNCLVFYGTSRRDSLLAATFVEKAREKGMKVLGSHRIVKESLPKIVNILATPTEYDEFRYPKQFTLRKDSLGGVFVASDDALIYTKVLGAVDTRGDSAMVIGSEDWLEQTALELDKYSSLPVVFMAPNTPLTSNPHLSAFIAKFVRAHGHTPSLYSMMGYEFMLFAGNQLKKNGVYFQEAMNKEKIINGYLTQGFNYQFSRDNQLVPFIRFRHGKAVVVDKGANR
ncbi:ABC transporter substrate-binding protein [Ohtaekwangia sp.]|uniref:ABC transporter substrate-binding protein n=1 Tax=Ohtaekwangia sp. TaxID=2066019 RepID=UPI002F941E69